MTTEHLRTVMDEDLDLTPPVPARLLSSVGVDIRRENATGSRWYLHPDGRDLNSVTTVLSATTSKPWLVNWAAGLAAEFAVDHAEHIAETKRIGGREAAVGLVKGAAQQLREEARERGTFVHDIVEAWILGSALPDFTDDPDIQPYAMAFLDWIIEWRPVFFAAEATVCDPDLGWAGTLDIIAWLPALAKIYVIDVKTGKDLDRDMPVQLGTYQQAKQVILPLGEVVPMPATEGTAILHIRPGRAKLIDVTDQAGPEAYAQFLTRLRLLQQYDAAPSHVGTVRYPRNADGSPGSPWLEDLPGCPLVGVLTEHGVRTVHDLSGCTEAEVKALRGCGPKRIAWFTELLTAHHLTWRA